MLDTSGRIPFEELELTPEYQQLTEKQRLFIATYCQGGMSNGYYDPVSAVRTAYVCKNLEVARVMSYNLLANVRILAVLAIHLHKTPTEEFLETLDRAIRNKHITMAQVQAMKIKAEMLGRPPVPSRAEIPMIIERIQKLTRKPRRHKSDKQESQPAAAPETFEEYGFK